MCYRHRDVGLVARVSCLLRQVVVEQFSLPVNS
jgi:hypothetical protein